MNTTSLLQPSLTPVQPVGLREKAITTLVRAFQDDPAARWLYPSDRDYAAGFPLFLNAFGGGAIEKHTAWETARYRGVAFWFAPGSSPDDSAISAALEETVPADRLERAGEVFAQMEAFHPEFPHWYLPLIGVEPSSQGKGYGSSLLRHVLETCDERRIPAYLESSNAANLPLYERHGFRVIGEIQAGDSPVIYPMLRRPA